ncbi:MAG: hypothetical protein A2Y24_07315 [Clostridiales bacterium GWE2_32_10]|nr:MAG: hypothetical protein A2Y24_07315 [Clostridiales bacterium GWE2_32_10]HBY21100.1 acid-soluble spore protein [Clostridiales bacterium]
MASNNNNSNNPVKKQARAALDQFKYEIANEIGVNLKQGYNGDLTTKEAGSVGGYMVKKMIAQQEEQMAAGNFPKANITTNTSTGSSTNSSTNL